MKKYLISVTAIVLVVVAAVALQGCKKDPEGRVLNPKTMGAVGLSERLYPEYENFTPSESIWAAKLLLINNCVNDPDGFSLPNIELKEAVWFLEAYFNLGVCQWQKYSPAYVDTQETYSMTIPLVSGSTTSEIILKGEVLQTAYRTMLQNIVTNIFPEYAVNFGDMFVENINWTDGCVTLGLDILYGPPQKSDEYEEAPAGQIYPCLGTPMCGRLIATDMNISPIYPTSNDFPQNFPFQYNVRTFIDGETEDIGMTIVLNQKRTWKVPMGIKCPEIWANTDGSGNDIYYYYCDPFVSNTSTVSFNRSFYDDLSQQVHFGTIYRDYICQVLKLQLPTGAIPLEAGCKLMHKSGSNGTVWHDWGIKRTCDYFIPPCFVECLHCHLVSFP